MTPVRWLAAAVIVASLALLAYHHVGTYHAARLVRQAALTEDPEARLAFLARAIEARPELANALRLVGGRAVYVDWQRLSAGQRQAALGMAERWLLDAIEAEPENWRYYDTLARVWLTAAPRDVTAHRLARRAVDEAVRLAPDRPEPQQTQQVLEALIIRYGSRP
ncbi:MAG: hypothetical protein QW838_05960 [Candidatus Nitrosotenuis sp.]